MVLESKRIGTTILRLIVVLGLLGCPRIGGAQGTWSVIATAGTSPGQVGYVAGLAVDTAGNLYVADVLAGIGGRIQKRDAQGHWSVIATYGYALGQVDFYYGGALAVDGAGNLYVADAGNNQVLEYTAHP